MPPTRDEGRCLRPATRALGRKGHPRAEPWWHSCAEASPKRAELCALHGSLAAGNTWVHRELCHRHRGPAWRSCFSAAGGWEEAAAISHHHTCPVSRRDKCHGTALGSKFSGSCFQDSHSGTGFSFILGAHGDGRPLQARGQQEGRLLQHLRRRPCSGGHLALEPNQGQEATACVATPGPYLPCNVPI